MNMYRNGFLGQAPKVEDQFDKVRPNRILQANVVVAAAIYLTMEAKELRV